MRTQPVSRAILAVLALGAVAGGVVLSRDLETPWRSIALLVLAGVMGAMLVAVAIRLFCASRVDAARQLRLEAVVWIGAVPPVAATLAIMGGVTNIPPEARGPALVATVVWLVATYVFTSVVLRRAVTRGPERPIAVRRPEHEPWPHPAHPRHA